MQRAASQAPATGAADAKKKEVVDKKKREELETTIRAKVGCDKAAYDVQWLLLEPGITQAALEAASSVLQPQHYEDIVVERALDGLCGFPPCSQAAPARGQGRKIHVSMTQHKVYDVSGLNNFCSRECAERSKAFSESLQPVSLFLRTGDPAAAQAAVAATKAAVDGESMAEAPPATRASTSIAGSEVAAAERLPAAAARPHDPAAVAAPAVPPTSVFDPGATLGGVVERMAAAPNLEFAQPAALGMIEGYTPARMDDHRGARGKSAGVGAARAPPRGPVVFDYGS